MKVNAMTTLSKETMVTFRIIHRNNPLCHKLRNQCSLREKGGASVVAVFLEESIMRIESSIKNHFA